MNIKQCQFFHASLTSAEYLLPGLSMVLLRPWSQHEQESLPVLRSKDDLEEGSVHMQAVGVLNESELFEPIQKETDS